MDDNDQLYPARRLDLVVRQIDGETLILDGQSGKVHQFNQTAGFIWNCCDGGSSMIDITSRLAVEFGLSVGDVTQDVVDAIGKFQELGLLASKNNQDV